MDKKLTLSLDQEVIEKAKRFAKKNRTSLSKMIEVYFNALTTFEDHDEIQPTPLVESLTGVIDLSDDFDFKTARSEYLMTKNK